MLDAALFRVCSERLFTKGGVGRSAAPGRPARQSLCKSPWSGLKNHTWVFSQEVDSSTMPRKSRKSRGTGSNELREKSIITSEVLAKHLSHTSFIFLWTLPAP